MPDSYETEGFVVHVRTSFNGTEGDPGSSLNWSGLIAQTDTNLDITDREENGTLDVALPSNSFMPDYFGMFHLDAALSV